VGSFHPLLTECTYKLRGQITARNLGLPKENVYDKNRVGIINPHLIMGLLKQLTLEPGRNAKTSEGLTLACVDQQKNVNTRLTFILHQRNRSRPQAARLNEPQALSAIATCKVGWEFIFF